MRYQGLDKGAEAVNKASNVVLGDTTSGTGTKSVKPGLTHMDTMHDIYFDADGGDDIEAPPTQSNETAKDAQAEDAVVRGNLLLNLPLLALSRYPIICLR